MKYKIGDVVEYIVNGRLAKIVATREESYRHPVFRSQTKAETPNDYIIMFYAGKKKDYHAWLDTLEVMGKDLKPAEIEGIKSFPA